MGKPYAGLHEIYAEWINQMALSSRREPLLLWTW